jgi:hypothetical protein
MKKNEVKIGATYAAKVSGKLAPVRITGTSGHGGWDAVNLTTKKVVRIKGAQRLRQELRAPAAAAKTAVDSTAKAEAPVAPTANVGGPAANVGDAKAAKAAEVEAWRKDVAAKVATPDAEHDATVKAAKESHRAKKAAKPKGERKPGLLTLAAEVLAGAKEPMGCQAIVDKVLAKGDWKTKGKTPAATLYAAIIREISAKGKDARFVKTGKNLFEAVAAAK